MTADGLAGELPTGAILGLCDKVLGEVGRRSHRFSWLRAPGGVADAWLPVEAYYPRHRLVLVCHREHAPYDHLFAQLVPEHGLRLLQFAPAQLGTDVDIAEQLLRRMIARLPEPPGREPARREPAGREPAGREPAEEGRRRPARLAAPSKLPSLSLPSLPGMQRRREPARERPPAGRPRPTPVLARPALHPVDATAGHADAVAVGVIAGLALAAVAGAELVLAVIGVALDSGRVILGLGLAFDACARVLGTLDAGRVGKSGWAWASAIIGSPAVVAGAVLWPRERRPGRMTGPGEQPIEATPLAGPIATLAIVCVLVGLVA